MHSTACKLTFGCGEMQHIAILPEHVNLLNARNGLHVKLLQSTLQLFVILSSRWLRLPHDLPTHGPLSTYRQNTGVLTRLFYHVVFLQTR